MLEQYSLNYRSFNRAFVLTSTKCHTMLRWSRGSARHTGSLDPVSTLTRDRLLWRSLRLRWLCFRWNAVFVNPLCTLWKQGCQMQAVQPWGSLVWTHHPELSVLQFTLHPDFLWDVQCYFDVLWYWNAGIRSADIVVKVANLFMLLGIDMHQAMLTHLSDASEYETFISWLRPVWVNIPRNIAPSLKRGSSRCDTNWVHCNIARIFGHAFSCEWTRLVM